MKSHFFQQSVLFDVVVSVREDDEDVPREAAVASVRRKNVESGVTEGARQVRCARCVKSRSARTLDAVHDVLHRCYVQSLIQTKVFSGAGTTTTKRVASTIIWQLEEVSVMFKYLLVKVTIAKWFSSGETGIRVTTVFKKFRSVDQWST